MTEWTDNKQTNRQWAPRITCFSHKKPFVVNGYLLVCNDLLKM